MTSARSDDRVDAAVAQRVRRYQRLLVLYPKAFRADFGDDLIQTYRDLLLCSSDQSGLRWRVARDLVTSATRERASALRPGGRPSVAALIGLAALLAVVVVIGAPGIILAPAVVLIGLPIFGLTRFVHAWTVRRATGESIRQPVLVGLASFVPATVSLAYLGSDAGYVVFLAVSATAIVTAAVGIVWAVHRLVRPTADRPRPWGAALLVLAPSIVVLTFIVGASLNSYRNSLGPPGDHSVERASDDTRALWRAADAGDVDAVRRITTQTCADPWVKFPHGNGRHNAKGQAETRGLALPGVQAAPYSAIADLLGQYQDDWHDRCGRAHS